MVSRADGFREGPNSTPGTSGRMKSCSRALVCELWGAREQTPEPRNPVIVAPISQGVQVCLQSFLGWWRIDALPQPARPSVKHGNASRGTSSCLDPAYRKNGFPFPPRRSLGVSLFLGPTPRLGSPREKPATIPWSGYNLGSTGSLSRASTPKTHSWTRRSGSPRTNRSSPSMPSANSPRASDRLRPRPRDRSRSRFSPDV